MKKIKLLVATKAFIIFEGKVLIIRESKEYKTGTQIGKYDLPGGRIKPEEKICDALKREVKEETNLDIDILRVISTNESWPEFNDEIWHIVRIIYLCKLENSENNIILSKDHDDYKWIRPEEYKKYGIIDNLIPCFQDYLSIKN